MTTSRDAADHIQKLPATQQLLPRWQSAIAMLINAAEKGGVWIMMARMGMLQDMNHGRERVYSDRKETHWGRRKLERDD